MVKHPHISLCRLLIKIPQRYLVRHPWQGILVVLGIALGVGVMVAIDLANQNALHAYELSVESVVGSATHQIYISGQDLDEQIYVDLRRQGLLPTAAPILTTLVSVQEAGGTVFNLMGIDPLVDTQVRNYWGTSVPLNEFTALLTQPNTLLVPQALMDSRNFRIGDVLHLEIEGRPVEMKIVGSFPSSRPYQENILIADLATVQEVTGKIGRIERIDLILETTQATAQIAALRQILPAGMQIAPVTARQGAIENMTAAFRLNLSALSLLALIVGLFLIYNTMTFSVVQRRPLFGLLRSLGVTQKEIFAIVLSEAALMGMVGALLGLIIGVSLARYTVAVVSQTINDLYFTTTVRDVPLYPASLSKAFFVGLGATLLTAIPPALEAARTAPRNVISRAFLERKTRLSLNTITLAGVGLLGTGLLIMWVLHTWAGGFLGLSLVILGMAAISAFIFQKMVQLGETLLGHILGYVGKMAPRNLLRALSRTGVASMSLMVAVAVSIGMGIMIFSFRQTVITWLEQSLQGDIYISAPGFSANRLLTPIDPQVLPFVRNWPGVARADVLRSLMIDSAWGPIQLSATDNPDIGHERYFKATLGSYATLFSRFQEGWVFISEPLANRANLKVGDALQLQTPQGLHEFPIAAIYHDYASNSGIVMMWLPVYRKYWDDSAITAIGLRLKPGYDPQSVANDLQRSLPTQQRLTIRPNRVLRQEVLRVFDQTFAITSALRVLATLVAFIGIVSALLLLQLERQREFGVLRALGFSRHELWRLMILETGLMGFSAGLLAIPSGLIIALVLIQVINVRSFGWSLRFALDPSALWIGMVISLLAAILAGIFPAFRLSHLSVAETIRYDS